MREGGDEIINLKKKRIVTLSSFFLKRRKLVCPFYCFLENKNMIMVI